MSDHSNDDTPERPRMFSKVLVANRGEIAIRAFRAAYELGAQTVAVFPHEDRNSEHRLKADEAYQIGEVGHPVRAYLSIDAIIDAAQRILARDGYAPKALNTRGDRLVYSNGMIILGLAAVLVLVIFQAKLTVLIQLYTIGVFVSFSLGQLGMVKHWRRELRLLSPKAVGERREAWSGLFINSLGATFTVVVTPASTTTS